jgi:SynChlorMet cassette radical SAM/SPASM protein ScmF
MADRKIQLPEGVPPLNTYYMYLTGGCNLACQHCWISPSYQANGGTGGHLDYDLFALAIEEGLSLGLNTVKLTGGEPLLHPEFLRIVDHIRNENINLNIETNGTLLTESIAIHLKENSTLSNISISLDGARPETHDAFRGVKGSFEKACCGIRNLVDVGYHPQIIMSPYAGNINEIESLVRLAEDLGAGSVKFNPVQPSGRGKVMEERGYLLDIKQLMEIGNWVEKGLQKQISIPLLYSWPMAFHSLSRLATPEGQCSIFNILGILSTGHLAMCGIGMQVPDLCYGMLGQDSVRDVWVSNATLRDLRNKLPTELGGVCKYCIFKANCLGYCVAQNYSSTENLSAPFWFCQQALELGAFPKSRLMVAKENDHIQSL